MESDPKDSIFWLIRPWISPRSPSPCHSPSLRPPAPLGADVRNPDGLEFSSSNAEGPDDVEANQHANVDLPTLRQ